MTNEEAKELLRNSAWLGTDNGIHVYKAVNKAIKALETQHKYRWHDLRKNPNDLPENNADMCLCAFNFLEGVKEPFYDTVEKFKVKAGVILAWKEIEPFEVTE